MQIRSLTPETDRRLVDTFFMEIADYIRLERAEDPGPIVTDEFFSEAPPGCDPAKSSRLGLFDATRLLALAEMAVGYPNATDAYLGFLAVSDHARGKGAGPMLLRHIEATAKDAGCTHLYLAVLDANPKGRAFWEREGFRVTMADQTITLGRKTQTVHRMGKAL